MIKVRILKNEDGTRSYIWEGKFKGKYSQVHRTVDAKADRKAVIQSGQAELETALGISQPS